MTHVKSCQRNNLIAAQIKCPCAVTSLYAHGNNGKLTKACRPSPPSCCSMNVFKEHGCCCKYLCIPGPGSIIYHHAMIQRSTLRPRVLEHRAHFPLCVRVIPRSPLIPLSQAWSPWQRSILGRLNTHRPLHPGNPADDMRRIIIPA